MPVTRTFWKLASAVVFCSSLFGQLTLSTVRGAATDPTGAVVANVRIELLHLETNAKRQVLTNDAGDFEIPDLQNGTYRLTAQAPGFKTWVADQIILATSQIRRINPTLEVGALGTEVTVQAGAALIQTDSAKIQAVVNTSKHFDNPWVGGMATLDPSLFITTAPLVSQTSGVWSSQWAGHSSNQVQEGQDGHTNDNAVNQLNDILDAQEITVVTVNNTAEFARVGYMNLVTKAGTNQFHGQAAYWNQNSALAARQFFADSKAKVLIHTISVSASGPVIKNKLFFYASANILKIPSKQFYLRDVPTNPMRGGDFSQLLAQRTPVVVKDPLNGQPFPNNVIPANRISPVSQAVNQGYLPAPNRGGADALGE